MGKAAKSKREDQLAEKEGDYEFKLPHFDEQAFIRRELASAKASFYTIALGLAAGIVSVLMYAAPIPWYTGWIPLFAAIVLLRPMLQKLGFSEDVTKPRALIGSYFMLFFTGLSVWMLGVNLF